MSVTGGQAQTSGVERFWRIDTIEGKQYSQDALRGFVGGKKPFRVTFWKPSDDGRFGGLVFQQILEDQKAVGGPLSLLPDGWWNAEVDFLNRGRRACGEL